MEKEAIIQERNKSESEKYYQLKHKAPEKFSEYITECMQMGDIFRAG